MFETKIAFLFCIKGDQIFLFFYNYDHKEIQMKIQFWFCESTQRPNNCFLKYEAAWAKLLTRTCEKSQTNIK